ncbi:hypothetical protein LguiA_035801 [Lonicera macranthoides]
MPFLPALLTQRGRHRGAPCDPRSSHPRVIRSWPIGHARSRGYGTLCGHGVIGPYLPLQSVLASYGTTVVHVLTPPATPSGEGSCGADVEEECYLVDPASSHMLVSKIKPCMFKKLVVGLWVGSAGPPIGVHLSSRPFCRRCAPGLNWSGRASGAVTLKKLECSKQAYALDTLAWITS